MNIIAGIPQGLTIVIVFLLVRAIAGIAAGFARTAGFLVALAGGMVLSSCQGTTAVLALPLVRAAIELASGLLLFSLAYLTLSSVPSVASPARTGADLARRLAVLALPAAGLLVPVLGSRLFPAAFSSGGLRSGLILGIAIWLSRKGRPLDLLLAAGAWLLMDSGLLPGTGSGSAWALSSGRLPAGALPYLLLVGSAGLIFAMRHVETQQRSSAVRNLTRDGLIALSAIMVISLKLLGANWGFAALVTGIAAGFGARNRQPTEITARAETLAMEAGLACCFGIGLGMGLAGSSVDPVETAIFAVAVLTIAALSGLLYAGAGRTSQRMANLFPVGAAPFAMILFAGTGSAESQAMVFGLAIACLAALPSARFANSETTGSHRVGRRWKPLVAVSRYGNAAGILAFAYTLADPDQPIRSVCVAASPGSQGPDAAEAEETLVRTVATGASSGYRILPSMVTAASISDGLARAAFERRSDCIVIGWNESPTPSDPGSRSVVDALVHSAPANVITVRKPEIFSRSRRLVFVTMAGSMPEGGYREAAAIAVTAWGRKPSGMEAIVIGGAADELASALGLENRQITTVPAWRDLPEAIRLGGTQVPAFLVAAARPDWPGWNPGTERIPLVIQDNYPESAMAVFYLKAPPAAGEAADDEHSPDSTSAPGVAGKAVSGTGKGSIPMDSRASATGIASTGKEVWPPIIQVAMQSGRIKTLMTEAVLIDAISTLTKTLFPSDRTAASRMASDFSAVARTEPIELAPGILLLHAHAKGIAVPALAVGVNASGWRLIALEQPVRIVIMLVSPAEAGPAAHLEALTQIAKAIRDQGFATAILDPERGTEFSPK